MWQNVRSASAVNSPTSPAVKINISGQSAATGNEIWEMNGHSDSWCWLVWLFGSEVSTFSREYLNTNNLHALLTISVKYYASLVKKGNFIQDKSGMTPPSNLGFTIHPWLACPCLCPALPTWPGLTSLSPGRAGAGAGVTPPTLRGSRSRLSLGSVIFRTQCGQHANTDGVIIWMVILTFGINWRNNSEFFLSMAATTRGI